MFRGLGIALAIALCSGASAAAQSVSPMKKDIQSFTDKFMFQVQIKNSYEDGQVSHIQLLDMDWKPIENGYVTHKSAFLGGGQNLIVTALIPFDGETKRQVYLCHSITPRRNGRGTAYKGEVCGKYTATRLS